MMLIVALMNPMFNPLWCDDHRLSAQWQSVYTGELCVWSGDGDDAGVYNDLVFLLYDRNDIGQVYLSVRKDHTGTVPGAFDVSAFCPKNLSERQV